MIGKSARRFTNLTKYSVVLFFTLPTSDAHLMYVYGYYIHLCKFCLFEERRRRALHLSWSLNAFGTMCARMRCGTLIIYTLQKGVDPCEKRLL